MNRFLVVLAVIGGIAILSVKKHEEKEKPAVLKGPFSCLKNASITSSSGSLVIANTGDKAWTHLKVVLEEENEDENFEFKYDGALEPNQELKIGSRLFTRSDGLIFNPGLYRPKAIGLETDQGMYGGTWCKDGVSIIERLANGKGGQ